MTKGGVDEQVGFGVKYIQETYGIEGEGTFVRPATYEAMTPSRYVPVDEKSDGIAIVSGGLDSITMVYYLLKEGHRPHMLSFDYGQRHKRELQYALDAAERLGLRWSLIDLSSITDLIGNSALTSPQVVDTKPITRAGKTGATWNGTFKHEVEVPEGHYAEDNMAITVVPNRNMTMLSIAVAVAVNNKYQYVAAGMHAGDHAQYPDCRPQFIRAFHSAVMSANDGFIHPNFDILVPWIHCDKNYIAQEAYRLGVQPAWTYSCYKGQPSHCGLCATCTERLEAIDSVHAAPTGWDETTYDDTETWKLVVNAWERNH
jgi:7-cyano-7-deazaguanine synthase